MAKITSCIIKVHYQCGDGSFDHHAIPPVKPPTARHLMHWIWIYQCTLWPCQWRCENREVNLIFFGVNKRLRNRREDHWHSILFGGDFFILFFRTFFLSLNCQSKGFSYFGWIPSFHLSLELVTQIYFLEFLSEVSLTIFHFLKKNVLKNFFRKHLVFLLFWQICWNLEIGLPFSHIESVLQRIILFCHRLSDPCLCTFLYSTLP